MNIILHESFFKDKSCYLFKIEKHYNDIPESIKKYYRKGNRLRNIGLVVFGSTLIVSGVYNIIFREIPDYQIRINEIIERCDKENFSPLKGKQVKLASIHKQKGIKVYILQEYHNPCGSCFIKLKDRSNDIIDIDYEIPHSKCKPLKLNKDEIQEIMNCFWKYSFSALAVDSLGNVYITDLLDHSIKLIRINDDYQGLVHRYNHVQGKWYVGN